MQPIYCHNREGLDFTTRPNFFAPNIFLPQTIQNLISGFYNEKRTIQNGVFKSEMSGFVSEKWTTATSVPHFDRQGYALSILTQIIQLQKNTFKTLENVLNNCPTEILIFVVEEINTQALINPGTYLLEIVKIIGDRLKFFLNDINFPLGLYPEERPKILALLLKWRKNDYDEIVQKLLIDNSALTQNINMSKNFEYRLIGFNNQLAKLNDELYEDLIELKKTNYNLNSEIEELKIKFLNHQINCCKIN